MSAKTPWWSPVLVLICVEGCNVKAASEFRVLPQSIAAPTDVADVAVMHEPIDQRGGHDIVATNLTPVFKAFVRREHR